MNKLIIFAALCSVLSVQGRINEQRRGDDGYLFQLDLDDDRCCKDHCLSNENSAKISRAVLEVIHLNGNTYQLLKDLKIIEFMSTNIVYEEFADNIKDNDFEYEGFKELQRLVRKYKVCNKVCKVYYELRKAIRENAANAQLFIEPREDGKQIAYVAGDLVVLSDILDELEAHLMDEPSIVEVHFEATTFIIDRDLWNGLWHGKIVSVAAYTIALGGDVIWDVTAAKDDDGNATEEDGSIAIAASDFDQQNFHWDVIPSNHP